MKKQLGVFVRTRPIRACNFVAYHGTYAGRVQNILQKGLRPADGGVWLTTSPEFAAEHAARKAAVEGCPDSPLRILRVRLRGCMAFRPITGTKAKVFMTPGSLPADWISDVAPPDRKSVAAGRARGLRQLRHRKKPRPKSCPPPIKLKK